MVTNAHSFFRILLVTCSVAATAAAADLRIGIIGVDTSHSVAFAKLYNDPANPEHVPGARITCGFKGGSVDVDASARRVDGFADEMTKTYGVKFYDSMEDVARNCDAIMLCSVDGRTHIDEARRVFPFHKPVFVDKPMGGSLEDVIQIFRLGRQYDVPVFASSSLRWTDDIVTLKKAEVGRMLGVSLFGPGPYEPHIPNLFFYGIHTVEKAYQLMGTGCRTVVRTHTPDTDVVTGVWGDGRVATVRTYTTLFDTPVHRPKERTPGGANKYLFGVLMFGTAGVVEAPPEPHAGYQQLIQQVTKFFQTGISPVPHKETVEVYAFMEAADESRRKGGVPVRIADVIEANGGDEGI